MARLYSHRKISLTCAGLDVFGLLGIIILQSALRQLPLISNLGWVVAACISYLVFGWLFGTYSILERQRIRSKNIVKKQISVLIGLLLSTAICRWSLNPTQDAWVIWRTSQVLLLIPLGLWSIVIRQAFSKGMLWPNESSPILISTEQEANQIIKEWERTPNRLVPKWLTAKDCIQTNTTEIAVSQKISERDKRVIIENLKSRDPREIIVTSPLKMVERHLKRLPPSILEETWLSYDEIPWADEMGIERKIKRISDVIVALILTAATIPLILFAAIFIWLEDRGPVFYNQKRSGLLGKEFRIWKLRTMSISSKNMQPSWTDPNDSRITLAGMYLRKLRLDELPQLINVIKGEMSLIGPRPERPEIEEKLEANIEHYRKRHWMKPGLSGWAQVNSPYASSIEDTELKLSYDLYYIKKFSIWLDLIILARTIKTVLKATGR